MVLLFALACSSTEPTFDALQGLSITGDATSTAGATWTYRATVDGIAYDLEGILLRPAGTGRLPAVIITHGAGGNAFGYSSTVARVMRGWGLVAIATNYTHAGGVPLGAPGNTNQPGASLANALRAHKLVEILRALGYVDMQRVAAHGHSMGAFVTTAVVAAYPGDFLVASHTAGGVRLGSTTGAAPAEGDLLGIRAPYQIHHGDADMVVPLMADQRFAEVLLARGVAHELIVYPGGSHNDVAADPVVLGRIRDWYTARGIF